ncbi:MAG: ABC transporter substrate-binding protein, partial [Deltaproteobacteria bacterium]|nr:ABC transporter substrate-binding protein [Deltaproteobacteria bacterium]
MAKILIIIALVITFCCGSALAEDPIKVGAPVPLTGPYASVGQTMLRAYEMAADEINAEGGLLGRQLKVISGDVSDCQAENAMAVAERLIAAGVDMVNTGFDSFSNANIKVYGKYDMPYMTGSSNHIFSDAIEEGMPGTNNCFMYVWKEFAYGYSLLDELFEAPKKMGWTPPNKKIAVIKVDFAYAMAPADLFVEGAKAKGYEVVMDEVIQFGKVDYGTILTKIERLKPSYVFFTDPAPDDAARFAIQFYDRFAKKGLEAIVVQQYAPGTPEFMELVGVEKAEGVLYIGGSVRQWLPANKEFLDRWESRYKERPFDIYSVICYDGFN